MIRVRVNVRFAWHFALLFATYMAAAEMAYIFYARPAVFPVSAAVALTGLVLGGIRLWPAVLLAGLTTYLVHGAAFLPSLTIALGNTLQPIVGAYILQRFHFDPLMRRMRDVFSLIAIAVTTSTIVPTVAVIGYRLGEVLGGAPLNLSWPVYWIGHMWALLIVAPFLIRWIAKPTFKRTLRESLETIAAFISLLGVDYLLFWTTHTSLGGVSFAYLILAPLFWIALRFGPRFTSLALVLTSLIGLAGVAWGPYAAIATVPLGTRLFQMEVFLIVIGIIYYIVTLIENERRYAVVALRGQINTLQDALSRISGEDTAKTQFLALLAHELRNPLAPMLSGLEVLQLKQRDVEETQLITMMDERVRTMRRLLDDLLDISRISRNKLTLRKEVVEIAPFLLRSVHAVNELSIDKTHTFDLDISSEPLHVEADPVRLEQIFVNLLKNAVKYTDVGGHIRISLKRQGESAVVCISDNGIGIEAHMLDKIFEPFVQVDAARAVRGGTGLGVGLSLTRMLVEMHNGTITASSPGKGNGSEFRVVFGLVRKPEESRKQNNISRVLPRAGGIKRILVVDDNVPAAEGMVKLLAHKGYNAEAAFSGMDCISKNKTFKPDAIVLDVGLPDMEGYEVARVLRAAEEFDGKLIALTGYGLEDDKQKAHAAGFDFHLTKPVSVADVEAVLLG